MASVKSWKEGAAGEPSFPAKFEVAQKAVLQVTDIKTNRNKYYAIELHTSGSGYRVYTHYGRTDDLESNPDAGVRESRYASSQAEAQSIYDSIYKQKTSARKGYKELNLASSKIGSRQTRGQSSGVIDEKTLQKMNEKETKNTKKPKVKAVTIPSGVQDLVSYLYSEATKALVATVKAEITANGIETPLGVLTMGQIDKGQEVLDALAQAFTSKKGISRLTDLSGEFYTVIPHKFGRSRAAAEAAVINTADKINEKQDTLQLMRDMLNVNGDTNVLVNPEIQSKYDALNCRIVEVEGAEAERIKKYAMKSAVKAYYRPKQIVNVWALERPDETVAFTNKVKNNKLLFHGSNPKNWVGILSRGILLPKIVVSLGGSRTDAGWLGNGIYFGDAICTSMYYAHNGKRGTKFIALADVALGKIKQYRRITYGIQEAPKGFDSCHGVRGSEFSDDEFVIYKQNQQKLQYLLECKG